jgi:hypothetical protein
MNLNAHIYCFIIRKHFVERYIYISITIFQKVQMIQKSCYECGHANNIEETMRQL